MFATVLPTHWPLYLASLLVFWLGYLVIGRRYFHPLSRVPGPFLWSVSGLPILYHQALREGKLLHVILELHEIYGPVVRIAPNEVHLSDPENYDKIYNRSNKYLKDSAFYKPLEGPVKTEVILTIIPNDAHRVRRAALNPFFSRRSVLNLEKMVWDKVHKLCSLAQSGLDHGGDKGFDAHHTIRAFSIDAVTEYAYACCWNQMDDGDLGAWYQEAIRAVQVMFVWFQTFPFLVPIFGLIPDWLNVMIFPPFKKWNSSLVAIQTAIQAVRKEIASNIKPTRRTIFHDLIDPPENSELKRRKPLSDIAVFADAISLTGAGTETTSATVERAIFEVISNPSMYKTLTRELRDAFLSLEDMNLTALEKLPFLTGVIKEALRLNPGVPGRLPRVVPPEGAVFNGVILPPKTVVSISVWVMHQNPITFPSPAHFDPTRWTTGPPELIRIRDRHLVPFGKGSRNCVGQGLAMCEIYCTIGAIFHQFKDLKVHKDFGRADLEMIELLTAYHPKRARKLRLVRG